MIGGFETEVEPTLGRRIFLKLALGTGALGAYAFADGVSRLTLPSGQEVYRNKGNRDTGLLSVCIPGFLADVRMQVAPLQPVLDAYGDTLMIQPTGQRYDPSTMAETTAEAITDEIKRRRYGQVVMNGISLGGNVAYDALRLLDENGTLRAASVRSYATMFDTPATAADLAINEGVVNLLARPPYGRITNLVPFPEWINSDVEKMPIESGADIRRLEQAIADSNDVEPSMVRDQVMSIVLRQPPAAGSLDFLRSLTYWHSLQGGDVIDAASARAHWRPTVGPKKFHVMQVDAPHTAFEAYPFTTRSGLHRVYQTHVEV